MQGLEIETRRRAGEGSGIAPEGVCRRLWECLDQFTWVGMGKAPKQQNPAGGLGKAAPERDRAANATRAFLPGGTAPAEL